LTVRLAVRRHRARHQFGRVTAAGAHIEHRHAGARAGEFEQRQRVAALVGLAIGVAAIGRGKQRGVIGRGLRPHLVRAGSDPENDGKTQGKRCGTICKHLILPALA
jgi:hypothetical protein